MYRDTKKLEYEIYDHTGNNCSQRNSNRGFKEKFGNLTGTHSKDSLEKTATLGTSQIIQEVLEVVT